MKYKYKKGLDKEIVYYYRYTEEKEKANLAEMILEKEYYASPVVKAELIKRRLGEEINEK